MLKKLLWGIQLVSNYLRELRKYSLAKCKLLGSCLYRVIQRAGKIFQLNGWLCYWQRLNKASRISLKCLMLTLAAVAIIQLQNQLTLWYVRYQDYKSSSFSKLVSPLIMYVDGTGLNYRQKIFLRKLNPFMIFIGNVKLESPEQVRNLIAEVKQTLGREHVLFMIDQEGGVVDRLGKIVESKYPSIRQLTANPTEDLATKQHRVYEYGRRIGKELKEMGIEINTMPVIDVVSKENEQMIRSYLPSTFRPAADMVNRSFSSDPKLVSIFAKEFGRGMQEMGVYGCIKHLPGIGGAVVDTHYGPAVIKKSLEELRATDFLPIYENIHDYPFAMVGWAVYPAIDPENPALLSKKVIKFIRDEFHYQGLLITDALNMGSAASKKGVDFGKRIRKSLKAGVDLVMPHIDLSNANIQRYNTLYQVISPAALRRFNRRLHALGYATD